VLKKQEAAEKHRTLSASVGATFTSNVHQLVNNDSLEYVGGYLADSFDCILTDPPYGMGADEFGDSGGLAAGAHGYADNWEYASKCYSVLAVEGYRITKTQAHAYVFCDIDNFSELKNIFTLAGWQVFRTPLIWYKRQGSRAPWPEFGPQRKYETILYAIKGKRPTLRMVGDVLDFPSDDNLGHAAQKPVALYQELLSRTCLPGDSVLDPFCGTGPIFPAAHALRVKATGIERDPASYGIAVARLQSLATKA
jgi:DNA modification methylase